MTRQEGEQRRAGWWRLECFSGDICLGGVNPPLNRASGSYQGVFCDVCARVLQSDAAVNGSVLTLQPIGQAPTKSASIRGGAKSAPRRSRSVALRDAPASPSPPASPPPPTSQGAGRRTINLVLSQFVVSSAVADGDFKWQLENSPASVLILCMDPIKSSDGRRLREASVRRQEFLKGVIERDEIWAGVLFEGSAGAVLYRKSRVADCRTLGKVAVASLRYLGVEFQWRPGYRNPQTAVAVGVCYKVAHDIRPSAAWTPAFLTRVCKAVREEGVRFLGGVFECPSSQASELGRSCGAKGPNPFAQLWRDRGDRGEDTTHMFHASFIFVIGPAKLVFANANLQPATPDWLLPTNEAHRSCGAQAPKGNSSALVRTRRHARDIPTWTADPDSFNESLPPLGDVKQKVALLDWWRPGIHQLLLYVGTAREGQGARERHQEKRHGAPGSSGQRSSAIADVRQHQRQRRA